MAWQESIQGFIKFCYQKYYNDEYHEDNKSGLCYPTKEDEDGYYDEDSDEESKWYCPFCHFTFTGSESVGTIPFNADLKTIILEGKTIGCNFGDERDIILQKYIKYLNQESNKSNMFGVDVNKIGICDACIHMNLRSSCQEKGHCAKCNIEITNLQYFIKNNQGVGVLYKIMPNIKNNKYAILYPGKSSRIYGFSQIQEKLMDSASFTSVKKEVKETHWDNEIYVCQECYLNTKFLHRVSLLNSQSFQLFIIHEEFKFAFQCGCCDEFFRYTRNRNNILIKQPKINWSEFSLSGTEEKRVYNRHWYRAFGQNNNDIFYLYQWHWHPKKLLTWLINKYVSNLDLNIYNSDINFLIWENIILSDIVLSCIPQIYQKPFQLCHPCHQEMEKKGIITNKYMKQLDDKIATYYDYWTHVDTFSYLLD